MKAVIFFSVVAIISGAQYTANPEEATQELKAREFWIDQISGLIWTVKDNGRDASWRQANKYCRDLRSARYSDWRLPTIDELEGIYDGSGFSAPPRSEGIQWALAGGQGVVRY
jgi:hypothetical protein